MNPREIAATVTSLSHAVNVFDPRDGRILMQNEPSLELFGSLRTVDELAAMKAVRGDEHRPALRNVYRLATRQGERAFLLKVVGAEGVEVQIFQDITELEAELDELYHDMPSDPVSKTLNRRSFMYALVREIARADRNREPCRLLLMAIDHLDGIVQVHGAASKEYVVANVAALLMSTVRQVDVIGRPQEDRFGLILPGADAEGGLWVAERSRQLIDAAPLKFRGETLVVSICVAAVGLAAGESPTRVLERAEQALCTAQERGPNQLYSLP